MATYIPGVDSYMPAFAPFTPDYAFLSNVLDVKTNRYNTNYEQLSDLYSQVVYGDLSRADTQEMRNQYTQNLGPKLQQISGMDLSVLQNAEAAQSIFKPYYENDLIVKDLGYTKTYQNQMRQAENLRTSNDPDTRRQWWQPGIDKLNYDMQDFVNASSDEALKMQMPVYVPDADLYNMSQEYFKGKEYNVEIDEVTKNWIITRKNGDLITQQALFDAQQALSNDPRVISAYATDAYVKGRNFAEQGVQSGQFSSIDEGEAAWASQQIDVLEQYYNTQTQKDRIALEQSRSMIVSWDNFLTKNSFAPGSEKAKAYQSSKDQYAAAVKRLKQDEDVATNNGITVDIRDKDALMQRAYNLLLNYNVNNDLKKSAINYARTNQKISFKPNPYGLKTFQYEIDIAKKLKQLEIDKEKALFKQSLKQGVIPGVGDPYGILQNILNTQIKGAPGTTNIDVDGDGVVDDDPREIDYMSLIRDKQAKYLNQVREEEADAVLEYMQRFEHRPNNIYSMMDSSGNVLSGTPKELRAELLKPENANLLDAKFSDIVTDVTQANPETGVTVSNKGADFILTSDFPEYYSKIVSIADKRKMIDRMESDLNKVLTQNYSNIINNEISWKGDGVKEVQQIRALNNSNAPIIFDYNQNTKQQELMGKEDYVNLFEQIAAQSPESININGYSPGWMLDSIDYGGLFSDVTGLISSSSQPMSILNITGRGQPRYTGDRTPWNREQAREFAGEMYDAQIELLNAGLSGDLNKQANEEITSTGIKQNLFKSFSPDMYMRNIPLEEMNAADLVSTQIESSYLNPSNPTVEASLKLNSLLQQVNETADGDIIFSMGEIVGDEADDTYGNIPSAEIAKELFDEYKTQVVNVMTTAKPTKTAIKGSIANISYINSIDPEGGANPTMAAYQLTFSDAVLKAVKDRNSKLEDQNIPNSIKIMFNKELDVSPLREGQFNTSSVISFIESSDTKQYVMRVPDGGDITVTQDHKGQYIMDVTAYLLTEINNAPKLVPQVSPPENLSQRLITDGLPKEYIDSYVNLKRAKLMQLAQSNKMRAQQLTAQAKTNP